MLQSIQRTTGPSTRGASCPSSTGRYRSLTKPHPTAMHSTSPGYSSMTIMGMLHVAPVTGQGQSRRRVVSLRQRQGVVSVRTRAVYESAAASLEQSNTIGQGIGSQEFTIDISQQEDFDNVLSQNASKLVVLMCKAKGCRPCKQFSRKFNRLAEHFTDAVFCEVIGDRNESTRNMMRSMKIRATPTFVFFRNGEKIHEHSGINPQKMIDALESAVFDGEAGFGEEHLHFVNGILSNEEDDE